MFAGTCTTEHPKAPVGVEEHPKKGLPAGVKGTQMPVSPALNPALDSADGQRKTGIPGLQPK